MKESEVIQLFKDSQALLTGHFKLTSGRHSDIYYEKFTLLKNPAICTRICEQMAAGFADSGAVTVVGPTTGGVIIAYEVARYLGVESIYAEAGDSCRIFKRGFALEPRQKVLIVDDVLTTGRSVNEVIDLVASYRADIVGIGVLLDRSNGTVEFNFPFKPLATVAADSWPPEECPLCAKGMALTQRGSRKA
jgi:orotate phosphoribosyltransferase